MRGVFYSKQKKCWGYDVVRNDERYVKYSKRFVEKSDAEKALRAKLVEIDNRKPIPRNPLVKIVNQFLVESAEAGRSKWRLEGMRYSFESVIIPHFGAATSFTAITPDEITDFIKVQKRTPIVRRFKTEKGIKEIVTDRLKTNNTIDHYITDLAALYNWAMNKSPHKRLADYNPVNDANLSLIANKKYVKPPLDPKAIDEAAKLLPLHHRVYYDFVRFTGSRKDEANRVEWDEHLRITDRDRGWYLVPGTKTPESEEWMPLNSELVDILQAWRKVCPSKRWAFPGRSAQTRGKKIYRRTHMLRILRAHGYRITVKDLRDYFANEIADKTDNPAVIMQLLRHKSLDTTTKYLRRVKNRMRDAVNSLVVNPSSENASDQGPKTAETGTSKNFQESAESTVNVEPC